MSHRAAPPEFEPPDSGDHWSTRPPWYLVVAGGGIFLTLIVVLAILLATEGDRIQNLAPTPTSVGSTTDTEPYASAMWPRFDSPVRYEDPVDAARGFAEDFLGFDEPIIGSLLQGDGRSGEVEIRPTTDGPATMAFVRLLGPDDSWWVLGAATEHIRIDEPDPLVEIQTPLRVSGEALAFDGVVEVELRADGETQPLLVGTVTAGAVEPQPFDGRFSWTNPGRGSGAVVLLTRSRDDGRVWSATAVRVIFASR